MARRRVRGNFRSLLMRLPESVAEELRALQNETGKMLLARAHARVPVKSGKLKAGLSYSVTPKTLRLRFGILGKAKNRRLFYGRILEHGRKAKTVTKTNAVWAGYAPFRAARGNTVMRPRFTQRSRTYRVGPIAPRRFVYNTPREQIYRPYQKLWGRALHRAAAGATSE